jgi:hypothetical protein
MLNTVARPIGEVGDAGRFELREGEGFINDDSCHL